MFVGSLDCLKSAEAAADVGTQIAKVVAALPALIWPILALYVVWLLRGVLAPALGRLGNFEAFGVKLTMASSEAMNAAITQANIQLASKGAAPDLVVPEGDRIQALERANRERVLLEGAEILWVDDQPSNNRNEARMLRGFGATVTFAASTGEAERALRTAAEQVQPFDLLVSDMKRGAPDNSNRAGLEMLERLRAGGLAVPLIFYVTSVNNSGVPDGAAGFTNRPDRLLHLVLDGLARSRRLR